MKLKFLPIFSILIALIGCQTQQQYDKHQMELKLTMDHQYPLNVEVSDVQAAIKNEKYTDWIGFKISSDLSLTVIDSSGEEWLLSPEFTGASVDSLYEFKVGPYSQERLGQELLTALNTDSDKPLQVNQIGAKAFSYSFEALIDAFIAKVDNESKLYAYYENQKAYTNGLIKSLYSFPGHFTKGYKWTDDFSLELMNNKGSNHQEDISVEWELLRFNEKEATFFGKGRLSYPKLPFDDENDIRLDIKRQFGINLVIDRTSNWIKRGTIDLREETGEVIFDESINADKRVPKMVRNIKVKLNSAKS